MLVPGVVYHDLASPAPQSWRQQQGGRATKLGREVVRADLSC
jgi:hypothetical protein